jgi:hypothetical protein
VGGLERRLGNLEARDTTARAKEKDRISREALSRVTDEDLHLLHGYLERAREEGRELPEEPTEEEEAALSRYEEIKEEVRIERT